MRIMVLSYGLGADSTAIRKLRVQVFRRPRKEPTRQAHCPLAHSSLSTSIEWGQAVRSAATG